MEATGEQLVSVRTAHQIDHRHVLGRCDDHIHGDVAVAQAAASDPEFRAALAYRWAPIHYQDVDVTGGDSLSGRSDYLSRINFDEDWSTSDSWEALAGIKPRAYVYYSVVETSSHWYIIYAFYHPRDWADHPLSGLDTHENDLEGALFIVARPGSSSSSTYGTLQGMVTVFHHDFYSFTPQGGALRGGDQDIDGTIRWKESGGYKRPVTAQEA